MTSSTSVSPNVWEAFNRKAREVLQYAPLSRRELLDTFFDMEELIKQHVSLILTTTTFVEDNLCYLLSEISSGVIKSRKVYLGKRVRDRISMDSEGAVEMGAENRRIFGTGFDLFKLSRMEREKAVPYVRRIIRSLRLSTNHYENILVAFNRACGKYCEISDRLAGLTLELWQARQSQADSAAELAIQRQLSEAWDQLSQIEMTVGCVEPNFLYGISKMVSVAIKKLGHLQERIIKAYSRLILKPVREKARSEMEADDLYQAGSFGLVIAIQRYDVRSGTSFPVFANSWIRQRIFGSTKNSSPLIKLSGSVWEMAQKIKAAERKLEADPEKRYNYSIQDIAELLEVSVASIEQVQKKVQSIKVVSLESLARSSNDGYDDDTAIDKALVDTTVAEDAAYAERAEFVERVLKHVDRDLRNLVCLRYGVVDRVDNSTLDERQIIKEIFRQLACKAVLQGATAGASNATGR